MNTEEQIKVATDIILKYEVDISYEEGVVHKGEYLLKIMNELGYQIIKKW